MILILKQCARCGSERFVKEGEYSCPSCGAKYFWQKRRLVETGTLRPSIKIGPPAAKETPPPRYSDYPPVDDKWRPQ